MHKGSSLSPTPYGHQVGRGLRSRAQGPQLRGAWLVVGGARGGGRKGIREKGRGRGVGGGCWVKGRGCGGAQRVIVIIIILPNRTLNLQEVEGQR